MQGLNLDTIELGTDAGGVNRRVRLEQEAQPFRERLAREVQEDFHAFATPPGINLDMKTIPALRGRFFVHFEVPIFEGAPSIERVPQVKANGASHVRDENGDLVYEDRPMFPGPPIAQINVDMSHDGTSWDTRMALYDLRRGSGEPVLLHVDGDSSLDAVADRAFAGFRSRLLDIAPNARR